MKHNWAIINDYQQHFTKMWASTSKYVASIRPGPKFNELGP